MPSTSLSVEMTGEEAKLFQSFQSVIRQAGKFEESLGKAGESAKRLSREEMAMAREAKRAFEEAKSPLDKYNQAKQTLDGLLKKNKISQDEYNAAIRKSKTEMDQAGQSGDKAFGGQALGMVKQFAGALGITGGLAGAVAVVRKEWEDVIDAQSKSYQMSLTLARPQETALVNLGAGTEADRDKFLASARALAKEVQVTEAEVFVRASDALSARGDKPVYGPGGAMDAVRASFGFSRGDPAAGIAASGAALDISAVTGGTAEQSLGFLQAVGQKARITDPKKLAVNLPPALTAAMAAGADPQTAAAMFAALTQGMADPTGESSRTASIALSQELRQFKGGGEAWAGMAMRERIAKLQADPELQKAFFADASFEKRAQTPIEQLLAGTGMAGRSYQQFLGTLPGMEESGRMFTEATRVRRGAPAQRVADASRGLEGLLERAATGRPLEEQFLAGVREQYPEIAKQAGVGWMERTMDWTRGHSFLDLAGYEDLAREKAAEFGPGGYRRPQGDAAAAESHRIFAEFADAIKDFRESVATMKHAADSQERAVHGGPALVAPGEDR